MLLWVEVQLAEPAKWQPVDFTREPVINFIFSGSLFGDSDSFDPQNRHGLLGISGGPGEFRFVHSFRLGEETHLGVALKLLSFNIDMKSALKLIHSGQELSRLGSSFGRSVKSVRH